MATGIADLLKNLVGIGNKGPGESGVPPTETTELETKADKFVREKWIDLKGAYVIWHQRLWESFLFYVNESWIQWDKVRKFWGPQIPADEFTPMPKINRFSPSCDAIASVFNSIPEVEAVAHNEEDERAIGIADVCNDLCEYIIKDNALRADFKSDEDKAGMAAQILVLAGSVFTEVVAEDVKVGEKPVTQDVPSFGYQCLQCDQYQSGLGAPVDTCPQCGMPVETTQAVGQVPVMDEEGKPKTEPVTQKKIVVRIGNPLWHFPRPGSTNMDDSPWHITAQRMPLDTIKERFGVKAEADNQHPDGYSVTYENAMNFYYLGYASSSLQTKDSCLVIQAYVKPGKLDDFPDGLWCLYFNQKVQKVTPWNFVEHPFTKAGYLQIPTLFWDRTPAFDLVECQRELNSYESITKLHALTCSVEPVVIDENTKVSEITGRGDKIVYWKSIGPGSKEPHRMQHGTLWPGIAEKIAQLHQEFQNISAAVSVFRGEQPGSVTAASAIATLRSQAEMQFSKPTANWASLWKETVRKAVKLYQAHKTMPELVEILGDEKITDIEAFLACDLDKTVEFKSATGGVPRTREEKKQEMMGLFDRGALDIQDPTVREKAFELFGETGLMQTFNDDARRARFNISRIKRGIPAMFRDGIDDPVAHLGVALQNAKSLDFERWDPMAQQGLLAYIGTIRQAQAAAEMAQAQMQQAMNPQPPPGKQGPPQESQT